MLGGHMLTGHEGGIDLWIHIDGEVLVLDDLGVTLVDLAVDPLFEDGTNDGVDNVGDVLPRQLLHLTLLRRQRPRHIWPVPGVVQHGLGGEAFEVGNLDGLNLRGFDPPPPAIGEVT